jgi:hypothetical protein
LKPYQIKADTCLVISDIHQDLNYAKSVIEKEKGNYDHTIFLGDFFDSHYSYPQVAGTKETARFMKEVAENIYGPATILASNHDINYAECWMANQRFSHKHNRFNACGGFTNSKCIEINKILSWENWRKVQMFCEFGDFLFSHAGFHPSFWSFYKSKEENLDALWEESDDALRSISIRPSRLFEAGEARGGRAKVGGPIWLDQDEMIAGENYEEIPPQICGHSHDKFPRKIYRNYIIDCGQTVYAMVGKDGAVEIKNLNGQVEVKTLA